MVRVVRALRRPEAPKYVVVATVEGGGFGADTAAPAVRDIYNQIFGVKARDVQSASSTATGPG